MTPEQLFATVRTRRRLLKVTQRDLAELAGVSLRTIIAIEKGNCNPSLEMILKILNLLGLSLEVVERVSNE